MKGSFNGLCAFLSLHSADVCAAKFMQNCISVIVLLKWIKNGVPGKTQALTATWW